MDNKPWWYSGANCLAALGWLAFYVLVFLTLLGYIERDTVAGLMAVLIFVIAFGASALGGSKEKKK